MKRQATLSTIMCLLLTACFPSGETENQLATSFAVATQEYIRLITAEAILSATPTPQPTSTPPPTATETPVPTETPFPTGTPIPTATPEPTSTFTPVPTSTPEPTPTNTRPPQTAAPTATQPPPAPDFFSVVMTVKSQMEGFGGLIDEALRQQGLISCDEVVNQHELVAEAPFLNVPGELAGPHQLYRDGVDHFISKTRDMYQNCKNFLVATPSGDGGIPFLQWGRAREGVNEAVDLLRQAIIAAGGVP